MAILGGVGNPVGGSFTGPAETLEIVGDHCYAFGKGNSSAGTSADLTLLLFTTGNYYSYIEYIGFVNTENATNICYLEISMNDAVIFNALYNNPQDMRDDQPLRLIIPSYTKFEFKVGQQSGGTLWSVIMAGKVYRD